jgi:hypothetical protein
MPTARTTLCRCSLCGPRGKVVDYNTKRRHENANVCRSYNNELLTSIADPVSQKHCQDRPPNQTVQTAFASAGLTPGVVREQEKLQDTISLQHLNRQREVGETAVKPTRASPHPCTSITDRLETEYTSPEILQEMALLVNEVMGAGSSDRVTDHSYDTSMSSRFTCRPVLSTHR